jgi:hypothetical protein
MNVRPSAPFLWLRRACFSAVAALASYSSLQAADEGLKVLFIGNSFTIASQKSIGEQFDHIANTMGETDPLVSVRATGGHTFQNHYNNTLTRPAISAEKWDYVILQNYSTGPTHLNGGAGITDHYDYGELLYNLVLSNHAETQVILYETWARAADHSLITGTSTNTSFESTAQMQSELRENYYGLAKYLTEKHPKNKPVLVAPVGDAWENAGGLLPVTDPTYVNLHGSDRYHGNTSGYYLSAAVFYSLIYGRSPEGAYAASPPLSISASGAFLEAKAWETVIASERYGERILIDFGRGSDAGVGINVVGPNTTTIGDLLTTSGESSTISLSVDQSFASEVDESGTILSSLFDPAVSGDSLTGTRETVPQLRFSGLSTSSRYVFEFYASAAGVADNLETTYTVEGAHSKSFSLNPANNQDGVIESTKILPDANGEILVTVEVGDANTSPAGISLLGAVTLSERAYTPLKIVEDLEDLTVESGESATFTFDYEGTKPIAIIWILDGVPQLHEMGTSLMLNTVGPKQDGTKIEAALSDGSVIVRTRSATLSVVAGTASPEFLSLQTSSTLQEIDLIFSEAMDPDAALVASNYLITSGDSILPVSSVSQSLDGTVVTLLLVAPVFADFELTLSSALQDLDGNALTSPATIAHTLEGKNAFDLLFDFGAANNLSSGMAPTWNNVSSDIGTSNSASLSSVVDSGGTLRSIGFSMRSRFNSANSSGTIASNLFPASATGDSLFGNVELFGGQQDIYPSFALTGLSQEATYDLTFYASRLGVSDVRETKYTVSGAISQSVTLDASNNIDQVVTLSDVQADANNEILVSLAPSDSNDNAYHFIYLNVLKVHVENALPVASPPEMSFEVNGSELQLNWEGSGFLEGAEDLGGPWTALMSSPLSPYVIPAETSYRFYRLR